MYCTTEYNIQIFVLYVFSSFICRFQLILHFNKYSLIIVVCFTLIIVTFSDCFWMLDAILEFTSTGKIPSIFEQNKIEFSNKNVELPQRMKGNHLYR